MSEVAQERFIRRITKAGSGYTSLCLISVSATGGESLPLHEYELKSQYGYSDEEVKNIVAELMNTAQDDANGNSTPSQYCIKAMRGKLRGERGPKFRLRSDSESGDDETLGGSEPATIAGVTGQLMRHLEVDRRTSALKDEMYLRALTQTMNSQAQRIQHYEDKHLETILRLEEMANEKEAREIARLQSISREKRLDEALKTFKPLVPVAIAKLKGVPADAKAGLQLAAITQVIKDLKPEQIEKLLEVLGPAAIPLGELFLEANKEDVEAEEAAERERQKAH